MEVSSGVDWTTVAVEVIALIGVIVTAIFGRHYVSKESQRADQAELEMKWERTGMSFAAYLEEWATIQHEATLLLENTHIDRFLVLRAWNGINDPRWTTAVYQMRLGEQEPVQYVHFELDADYQQRLREISARNSIVFEVSKIPDSSIRHVYEAEGVKHAAWFLIDEQELEGTKAKCITYCSFATHEDIEIGQDTLTRCQLLVGRLKGVSASFHN